MNEKITIKEQKFIDAYLSSNSIAKSMIQAGYKANSASVCGNKMLKKPKIAKAVAEGKAKIAKMAEITTADVIANAKFLYEHSAKMVDGKPVSTAMAIKANDQLARLTGSYIDKLQVDAQVKTITVKYEDS